MNAPDHTTKAAKDAEELHPIYFTEAAKSINLDMVKQALIEIGNKYPAATKYTFQLNDKRDDGKPVDVLTVEGGENFLNSVRHCVDWLTHFGFIKTQRKTFNTRITAYGHKHRVETWIRSVKNYGCGGGMRDYVPMFAFVSACWILGIPEQSIGGDNPFYPLSVRSLRQAEYSHRVEPVSRWSWTRHKAAAANAGRLAQL